MGTIQSNCRSCRGTGKVPNRAPEWLDYLEEDEDGEEDVKPEPVDCGPQYFECSECEGRGIKLTAAGEEVGQ